MTKAGDRRKHAHWTVRTCALFILLMILYCMFDAVVYTTTRVTNRVLELTKTGPFLNAAVDLSQAYDVIISAYMNSGSTYTGRLLGHRADSFYFYEPLWRLNLWGYFKSNNLMCSTRSPACRKVSITDINANRPIPGQTLDFHVLHDENITDQTPPLFIPLRVLDHVFNCRLRHIRNLVQPGVTAEASFAGPRWNDYRYCLQRKKSLEYCLDFLETKVCKPAKHIVAKVLRLDVGCYRTVLQNNPHLKVVHLFRDPRAIIHSRIKTIGYPIGQSRTTGYEIELNAKSLCAKMTADLRKGTQLLMDFPGRFRFVHYEDIYLNDQALVDLHTFLGMTITSRDLTRIRSSTSEIGKEMEATARKQRKDNNSVWWRSFMPWETVKIVNAFCSNVIDQLGYEPIKRADELREFNQTKLLGRLKYSLSNANT